jgi:predicted nucleotidyltransferase
MKKFDLKLSKRKIVEFCKRNHIRSLSLFGSILHNDFSRSSDIDVLVEFEIGYVPVVISVYHPEEYSENGVDIENAPHSECSNADWTDTYHPDI